MIRQTDARATAFTAALLWIGVTAGWAAPRHIPPAPDALWTSQLSDDLQRFDQSAAWPVAEVPTIRAFARGTGAVEAASSRFHRWQPVAVPDFRCRIYLQLVPLHHSPLDELASVLRIVLRPAEQTELRV